MASLTFIGLPLCTRSHDRGMSAAVRVLREKGIIAGLQKTMIPFIDCGDVVLSEIHTDSGPKNLTNFHQFLQDTERIRSAINQINAPDLVFGLGGECSIIVGTLAGLKNNLKGKPGVVWIDAHGDFNTQETTPSGYIGGMCLALACGRGPKLSEMLDGERLLDEKNLLHLASRSIDPAESENMLSSPMRIIPASALKEKGISSIVNLAASSLADRCDWIVCHLDVDSLDPKIMPAANFPEQNGLSIEETKQILDAVNKTGKLKLFELAGYNPDLDQDRTCATKLVTLISDVLGGARRFMSLQ